MTPMRPLVRRLRAVTAAKPRHGEEAEGCAGRFVRVSLRCVQGALPHAVEGDEEEVDGEGHPEGDEDVWDVEAGVEVGADAGGHGEGGVEAGAVGGAACADGES